MPLPSADSELARRALLPAGLRDSLPPEAAHRARLTEALISTFGRYGYDRVDPPLVEFEDSLLAGDASAIDQQVFRLLDPVSRRMMGVRADLTIQVARIATTRLGSAPRPLRLSYAGDVLRVAGSQLRPERQFTQVGAELIGAPQIAGDVEIMQMTASALAAVGVKGLSIDVNSAQLVPAIFAAYDIRGGRAALLRAALDRKDADTVARQAEDAAAALGGLLAATGPARTALVILTSIDLPEAAAGQRSNLVNVLAALDEALPEVTLTCDPVENRGFEYHTGFGFTLFAEGVRGELGRGGRYLAGGVGRLEPATGVSLYMDSILRALPTAVIERRLFVPFGVDAAILRELRQRDWIVLSGLEHAAAGNPAEARRLGCSHLWDNGKIVGLDETR